MKKEDVVVVGAGAAGLCAAIEAARAGASVLVLERMDKPAKKILATGNGKCNYTNRAMRADCYRGSKNFIQSFLECCPWEDTVAFFAELGIWPKERDGYFYPNSEQAASVAKVLLDECASLGVNIALSEPVLKAKADSGGFTTDKTAAYRGRNSDTCRRRQSLSEAWKRRQRLWAGKVFWTYSDTCCSGIVRTLV